MSQLVVGRVPALEALRARKRAARVLHLAQEATGLDRLRQAAQGIRIVEQPRAELDTLARGLQHQGVILEAEPLPVVEAETWLEGAFAEDAVVVVLDGVEDPHNFGAIVRSAAACGAVAVLFGKDRAAPISSTSMKSAAGAMEYITLVQANNLVRTIDALKEVGFWIAALEADAPTPIWNADLKGRVALVVGSEGKGIRRLVRAHSDLRLRIPLTGAITSLNASVSAAIALAECRRQRLAAVEKMNAPE